MCPRAFSLAAQFTLNFYNNMHPYYGGIDFILGHALYMKAIHGGINSRRF